MVQASDGSFVMAGFTNSFGAAGYDIYIVKTSVEGEVGLAWNDSSSKLNNVVSRRKRHLLELRASSSLENKIVKLFSLSFFVFSHQIYC